MVHEHCAAKATRTVNMRLTLRNWAIGAYIHHFEPELFGMDRAKYGEALIDNLAERLMGEGLERMEAREIGSAAEGAATEIRESAHPELAAPLTKLFTSLSFTHIAELIVIDDPLKRGFYEVECIRGNWSVRALKRQIATLYFERSGMPKDKKKLAAMVQ